MGKFNEFLDYLESGKVELDENTSSDIREIGELIEQLPRTDMPMKDLSAFRSWLKQTIVSLGKGTVKFSQLKKIQAK